MADSSDLSRPRVDAQDVKGLLNFRQEGSYPDRVGLHLFGTLEKGFAWFSQEKLLPENTDTISRGYLLILEDLYKKAIPISHRLHGSSAKSNSLRSRRRLSKSEEAEGLTAEPDHALTNLLQQINFRVRLFESHKESKKLERDQNNLNIDLLKAIEVADQGLLIFSLGDYYVALCKDFKDSKEFTMPSERHQWKFLGYTQYSEIVAAYDAEQAEKDKSDSDRPLTKSLNLALKYTGKRYKSVDQIISFMRSYGNRNLQVHPVKKFFDEGAADELRKAILRDYNSIPFLGNGPETDVKKKIVMEVLEQVVERFYAAWTWEDPGHWRPSAIMMEIQARYEERMKGKILIFNNEPFEIENTGEKAESNLKKGDRTREKSLTEEDVKENIRNKKCEYEDAIAQCAGQVMGISGNSFVEAVLRNLKKETKEATEKSQIDVSNAAMYKKKWDSAISAATMAKEKMQKRMDKLKNEIAELKNEIAELEVENDDKDARIVDLEAENSAKDARIAQLEARIEAIKSK